MKRIAAIKPYLIGLCMIVSSFAPIYPQVTIGSKDSPIPGALLELKEENETNKGLLLPRVSLEDPSNLFPMLKDNPDYTNGTIKASEDQLHIGLMVYNVNKCLNHTGYDDGLYAWDGKEWLRIGDLTPSSDVHKAYDQDGNLFYYRKFGKAGYWMLENLRAKNIDPVRDNSAETVPKQLTGPEMLKDVANPLWSYPGPHKNMDKSISVIYDAVPAFGLLYNWAAATNCRGGANGTDFNVNESGKDHARIQGICPSGWHLPSDKEWTLLENELQTNTHLYSSQQDIGGTIAPPGNITTAPIAAAMTGECIPYRVDEYADDDPDYETNRIKGTSKSIMKGGFSIMYAGYMDDAGWATGGVPAHAFYGWSAVFWTSSADKTNIYDPSGSKSEIAIARHLKYEEQALDDIEGQRRSLQASVRCVKNDP